MPFDIEGARKAGYSDAEIADHLAKESKFDAGAARKSGYSDSEIIQHLRQSIDSFKAGPTDREKLLSSTPMRVAKGLSDPIQGAAQLARKVVAGEYPTLSPGAALQRMLTDRNPADTLDWLANKLGGEGTFAGDVLGIKGASDDDLRRNITESEAEYQAARKATGQEGIDFARLAGNVLSPVNALLGRVVPVAAATAPMRTIAARGAAAGAAGAAMQPATGENFEAEKALQVGLGAAAGGLLGPVVAKAGRAVGRMVEGIRRRPESLRVTPDQIRMRVREALEADNIDVKSIPDEVFDRLSADATRALQRGQKLDPASALRAQDFEAMGLPYTRGQVGRDPGQWQSEFNLSGIEDAGRPLRDVLQAQSRGVARRFQAGGAAAGEKFDDAGRLIADLQGANAIAERNVRTAYDAFRKATGRNLEVPMQGLAQDYAEVARRLKGKIPDAVQSELDSLGLLTGTQRRVFDIDAAEDLIKIINENYDPLNAPQKRALDALRESVQKSIVEAADVATDGSGAEAAHLAMEARNLASQRFKMIEQTPALRAAIDNAEPDDFIRKYVIGGKVNELGRMFELLGPESRDKARAQMVRYLESKAFGANAAGDGKVAQATFNNELQRIGRPKLVAVLGQEGADEMQRIGRVLAYIKQAPEGATPNTSGTSQALLSVMERLRGVAGLPYISDFVVKPIRGFSERQAVSNALQNTLTQPADLDPQTVRALTALLGPASVSAGVAAGGLVR